MDRRKLWEKIETGVIVTVIAVLVWLYAEGENVQTYNNEQLLVRFVPVAGQELAIDPQDTEILVSFRAAAGERSSLEEMLRDGPIEIKVGNELDSGSPVQTIVLRDALERSDIGSLGINIIDTSPATKQVRVEPLVTRRLPVEPAKTDVQFAETPVVTPSEVTVKLPRSLAEQAGDLPAIARLDLLDLGGYDENTDVTATTPVDVPEPLRSPWTTVSPATVQVRFNIRKLTDSVRLPNIPLRINADPLTLQEYDIILGPSDIVLRDVRFSGPSDEIEAIASGETKVWAELRPTREQIERAASGTEPVMLSPVIITPPGVQADLPDPVPVTIRRK